MTYTEHDPEDFNTLLQYWKDEAKWFSDELDVANDENSKLQEWRNESVPYDDYVRLLEFTRELAAGKTPEYIQVDAELAIFADVKP